MRGSTLYRARGGGELVLAPQLGLAPLERDPVTGLWEFCIVASGERPQRNARRPGEWAVFDDTGIVLVLLPGTTDFVLGPQGDADFASPAPCSVALHPIFIARYEVTQGQWQRVMGTNAVYFSPAAPRRFTGDPERREFTFELTHPVETITALEAQRFCSRLALRVPFEAQWCHAARGGTPGLYCWGDGDERSSQPGPPRLARGDGARGTPDELAPADERIVRGGARTSRRPRCRA